MENLITEKTSEKRNVFIDIFFFRQLFSCNAVILNFFVFGLYTGAPTVIIPQMVGQRNSTEHPTPEMVSWLSSASAYSAIPWAFILPLLAHSYGRKNLLILLNVNAIIGNIIFYWSTNIIQLIISQVIQGMLVCSSTAVMSFVMCEFTSPKYRDLLLTIKSSTFFWGIWISNAIGTFYHWSNIGIVVFVCCICNLSAIFCCESPYWLATKGRFDECAKAHRWLKGIDEDSEEELRKLILSQKEQIDIKGDQNKRSIGARCIKTLHILRSKILHRSLTYAFLPICLYSFSGKYACNAYAIDIIKKFTSSEEMAYNGMLILDAVTLLGVYIGCGLPRFVTRRVQLIALSSTGICFLYILSIYLYVIKFNIISENKYISLVLLTGFSASINCGPMILTSICADELSTLRYTDYFLCCLSLLTIVLFATLLKISPFIFKNCGTHGAFLFYAVSGTIVVLLSYKYMSETKDKTIQEIDEHIAGEKRHVTVTTELHPLKMPE